MLELQSSPNASKSCPNCSHSSFTSIDLLQNSTKSHHSFWLLLLANFATKNFQKPPNLVTLAEPPNPENESKSEFHFLENAKKLNISTDDLFHHFNMQI